MLNGLLPFFMGKDACFFLVGTESGLLALGVGVAREGFVRRENLRGIRDKILGFETRDGCTNKAKYARRFAAFPAVARFAVE